MPAVSLALTAVAFNRIRLYYTHPADGNVDSLDVTIFATTAAAAAAYFYTIRVVPYRYWKAQYEHANAPPAVLMNRYVTAAALTVYICAAVLMFILTVDAVWTALLLPKPALPPRPSPG